MRFLCWVPDDGEEEADAVPRDGSSAQYVASQLAEERYEGGTYEVIVHVVEPDGELTVWGCKPAPSVEWHVRQVKVDDDA